MKVDLLDTRRYNYVNVRPSRLEDFWYDRSREGTVGNKLYVGSLSYQVTDQTLQELFAQYGTVTSAKVISDRYTGQSRGFGFVEMATSEEAQKAISALNGTQHEGRTLVVNEAKPQEKRDRSWGGGGGGGRGGGGGSEHGGRRH